MSLPTKVQPLCDAFVGGLRNSLGGKLHGVYLHGAVVFPEAGTVKDVDFHVLVQEPLTSIESREIGRLHADLAQQFPPIGAELDCYYILLGDARKSAPPQHQLNPTFVDDMWALHRAHMLAGRCVVLHGPEPAQLFAPPSWAELTEALEHEIGYILTTLDTDPAYCVLNLCRVMYSVETKDVVTSKRAAAAWAGEGLPTWRHLIGAAVRWYEARASTADEELLGSQSREFFEFVQERVRNSPNWPDS